jgi:sugar transferase EpsL
VSSTRKAQLAVKRAIDIVGASALLIATAPLLAAAAVAIPRKLGSGGVFFRQLRPGHREKPFEVIKFRTMTEAFDEQGRILPEGERLPPFGWALRKYSIDELPQLINVLRGEMSLVGPRPLLMEYLQTYPPEYRRRHDVKPGISGWAQVNGRHHSTFKQRLEMDVWYVDHWNLWIDLKILLKTIGVVLDKRDVERPDQDIRDVDDLNLHAAVKPRMRNGG